MIDSFRSWANLFKILAHPSRLAILDVLRSGEQCVCHLEAALKLRQANISQHLKVLREAGLLVDRRDGWNMFYRVSRPEVLAVVDAMADLASDSILEDEQVRAAETCPCPKCNPAAEDGSGRAASR